MKFGLKRPSHYNTTVLEERLILACVQDGVDGDAIAALLHNRIRWDALIKRSLSCRVTPFVYFGLKSLPCAGRVPAPAMERLRDISARQALHLVELSQAFEEILARFSRQAIPSIVLKGAAVANAVYRRPYMRMVGDLDLLVPRDAVPAASSVLHDLGYRQSAAEAAGHYHLAPFQRGASCVVELHWHILLERKRGGMTAQRLWRNTREFPLGGATARMFAPELLLLHVLLHAALGHALRGALYQLCDIREIVSRFADEIDWDSLVAEVRGLSLQRPVYLTLRAAAELTGAAIPCEVLQALCPAGWSARTAALTRALPHLALKVGEMVPEGLLVSLFEPLIEEQSEWTAWRKAAGVVLRNAGRFARKQVRTGSR